MNLILLNFCSTGSFGGNDIKSPQSANIFVVWHKYKIDETVKNLITGKLYDKRIDLLEKNAGYSVFLKKFYQGVNVRVVNTVKETEEAYVDVEIESQDGSQNPMTLTLKKDGDANWKISDEIENP